MGIIKFVVGLVLFCAIGIICVLMLNDKRTDKE